MLNTSENLTFLRDLYNSSVDQTYLTGRKTIGYFLVFTSLFGAFENGLIIAAFLRNRKLQTRSNICVIFLAFDECIMSILGSLIAAVSSFYKGGIYNEGGCGFHGFIMSFLSIKISVIITVISFDRYISVVRTQWRHFFTKKKMIVVFLVAFVYSFVFAIFPVIGWGTYRRDALDIACSVSWNQTDWINNSFLIALLTTVMALPCGVMTFCYASVYKKIKSDAIQIRSLKTRNSKMQKDIKNMTLIIFVTFFSSWLPYVIILLWTKFEPMQIPKLMTVMPNFIWMTSAIWNPIIYIFRNKKLIRAIKDLLVSFTTCFCAWKNKAFKDDKGRSRLRFSTKRKNTEESIVLRTLNPNPIVRSAIASSNMTDDTEADDIVHGKGDKADMPLRRPFIIPNSDAYDDPNYTQDLSICVLNHIAEDISDGTEGQSEMPACVLRRPFTTPNTDAGNVSNDTEAKAAMSYCVLKRPSTILNTYDDEIPDNTENEDDISSCVVPFVVSNSDADDVHNDTEDQFNMNNCISRGPSSIPKTDAYDTTVDTKGKDDISKCVFTGNIAVSNSDVYDVYDDTDDNLPCATIF